MDQVISLDAPYRHVVEPAADKFARDGYVIIQLDVDIDRIAGEIIAGTRPFYDDSHRLENAWRHNKRVRELALLPQVNSLLTQLYGRQAFPFQTLNFDRGTEQAIHSDTIHFDSNPSGYMAGVWVALEDIDEKNGPLLLYPGSHKLAPLRWKDFGVTSLKQKDPYRLYRSIYEPGVAALVAERGLRPIELRLRKGEAVVWAANTLHGGAPILDGARTRHSQVTHYYFTGCQYHCPLLSDSERIYRRFPVDIRTGKRAGGGVVDRLAALIGRKIR